MLENSSNLFCYTSSNVLLFFRKAHLSSKKLLEQCQKLEKLWSHVFTTTLNLVKLNKHMNVLKVKKLCEYFSE